MVNDRAARAASMREVEYIYVRMKSRAFETIVLLAIAAGLLGTAACKKERLLDPDGTGAGGAAAGSNPAAQPRGVTPRKLGQEEKRLAFRKASPGDVPTLVKNELASASQNGRSVVVYVGATWCEPCQRFHEAAERGELDAELPPMTFLEFDADVDTGRLRQAGYSSSYIPLFAVPGSDGRASGRAIEGGIKGAGAAREIAPRLKKLLGV
jgi:thiol-disulfide isomerase/thioredoxin